MEIEDRCQLRVIHNERVVAARKDILDAHEIDGLCLFFKAMADQTRLKIILALNEGEMCVCDLAAFLEISESAVSHQLRFLRQLTLVTNRRQGPILYYRLTDDHVSRVAHLALEHIRE
ncbi:MAG: metalloregulator ArsR/SmtB family transcription factor [Pseudomonadota bacterium]